MSNYVWNGAAVGGVADSEFGGRSQQLRKERVHIEELEIAQPGQSGGQSCGSCGESLVEVAGKERSDGRNGGIDVGSEKADVWGLAQIGHIGDEEHPRAVAVEGFDVGGNSGDRGLNDANACGSAGIDGERVQSVLHIVGSDPDHEKGVRRRLAAEVGEEVADLDGEVEVGEDRRAGAAASVSHGVVGKETRGTQRGLATVGDVQRSGELLCPGGSVAKMMAADVIGVAWRG